MGHIPTVSAEDVRRVLAREFAAEDVPLVESVLADCAERESHRVHLAVLKLAKGDLNRLDHYARAAREDSRDVLAWAEYRAACALPSKASDAEMAAAEEEDWAEYQEWLGRA